MAEYIEREALLTEVEKQIEHCYKYPNTDGLAAMFNISVAIEDMPAADVVDVEQLKWERDTAIEQLQSYGIGLGEKTDIVKVNHGEWELLNIGPDWADTKCSQCGAEHGFSPYKDFYKFCPDCGAKMDKEEEI